MIDKKERFKINLDLNTVIESGIIMFILLYGGAAVASVFI
jgi:hypothetical protein